MYLKKILALLALFSIGSLLGIGYNYWQNATTIPEWYTARPVSGNSAPVLVASPEPRSAAAIQEKIKTAQPGQVQEQLTAAEVDNLIMASLTKTRSGTKPLPKAIKSLKTQIQPHQIRAGAIIDLAEIEQMPASPRTAIIGKLVQLMPQLRGQPVYIGVVGQLGVTNGQPRLADDAKLQIGKVELPLDQVARQLGVSRSALEQNLTSYLQFRQLNIDKIDLTDRGAVITGQKK